MKITRTESFDLAFRFVTETNLNIFLTGKAGTGKTTFLKFLRENSFKKMVVAAPTGVAAINAGGTTLHSLFQLPFGPFIPSPRFGNQLTGDAHSLLSKIRFHREKLNLFRYLELLIIDEASMVAAHTVDAIDTILRSVRRRHHLPFGGVQVLFIGDLHQLQPVVKNEEWQLLKEFYSSVFFFDSKVLRENVPVMIELKEIFRQKDDVFIELLNQIRHNNLSQQNFNLLNSRLRKIEINSNEKNEINPGGEVTLTTHNQQADKINEINLQKLKGKAFIFRAEVKGDFPEHQYPAEKELILKEGAQVMFIKNDTETKKYFNGKTGVVTYLSDSFIKVKCPGEEEEIYAKKNEWKNVNYSLHADTREVVENVLGSFEQYPLRLAWAITIHKSQGLTFNRVIIDAENAFANGQVYVALSRCTSLEGLTLTSPVNQKFLGAHQNLKEWQEKNQDDKNLSGKLIESRQKFALQELQDIFTWTKLHFEMAGLKAQIEEHTENLTAESFLWMKEIMEKYLALEVIAGKFSERISQLFSQNNNIEENTILQQRIKDAANYFSGELLKWKDKFFNHPLSTDTKKSSRPIDLSLNEINFLLHNILNKINYCKEGFTLTSYLENQKKSVLNFEKIATSYAGKQSKTLIPQGEEHPELYLRIVKMRKHLADIGNIPLFLVFGNSAINNVCTLLPTDKESLLKVKGFGKAKVSLYGEEIINLVNDYCQENDLSPPRIISNKRERKSKTKGESVNTVAETVRFFKEGKSIQEIAAERSFAIGTIEGHLAKAIKEDSVKIEEILPMEEVQKVASLFPAEINNEMSITGIKEKAPPDFSYGKLRMVLAWLQKRK